MRRWVLMAVVLAQWVSPEWWGRLAADPVAIEVKVFQKAVRLPANVGCPDLLASFIYLATLPGLASGTFHVRVEQTGEGSGRNGLVSEETVVVQ